MCDKSFVLEMLEFAKTLKGRERSKIEKEIAQESIEMNDKWHYFMIFGIQPDTQAYIDETIRQLGKCENIQDECICKSRLNFSVEDLKVNYPVGSQMEKYWKEFYVWKATKKENENVQS